MEKTALPGALRISHDTWLLTCCVFQAQPPAPLLVKGSDTPSLTYLVQGMRPVAQRLVAQGLDGEPAPLVGRNEEF